jgi:hypothetical protein
MQDKRLQKIFAYILSAFLVLVVLGYIIGGIVVRRKVAEAVRQLPPTLQVSYTSLHPLLFQSAIMLKNLDIRFMPRPGDPVHSHHVTVGEVNLEGIGFFAWIFSHKLKLRTLRLEDCNVDLDRALVDSGAMPQGMIPPFTEAVIGRIQLVNTKLKEGRKEFSAEGDLEVDSIHVVILGDSSNIAYGAMHIHLTDARYDYPEASSVIHLRGVDLAGSELRIDTARITPTVDKLELGKIKGHQEDVVEGSGTAIKVTGLDLRQLRKHRLIADRIIIGGSQIQVFRDRRLPLEAGEKPLPVDYLKTLPVDLRIHEVEWRTTTFTYEEFPKDGEKTGYLKIVRLKGHIAPLINHPQEGDPAYITVVTEGSLMGSGTVESTMHMPLHKGDPYTVDGAFHDLDVTSLNPSAENLGDLHLESGLLNSLVFSFSMTAERATGKIVGEYHNLVADKLKGKGAVKKTDKFKSFFLKHLIIPKDKDHTLDIAKRTGKVDYKRDPSRYFSYYMLHALLVGVKSSFSLGFLLPG